MSQPYLPSHTPAPPPNPVPQHSTYVPPPPSLPPQPVSSPLDQGFGVVQQFASSQSQINVPPPPPLHDNPSPVYAQGSRPLPQPQQPRRQSTLPTPPMANGGFIPTNVSNQQIAPVSPNLAYNNSIPPPPPLPVQQQVPFPPSPQHLNPGPPPPLPTGNRIVSSSFPVPPRTPVPGSIPMVVPPPPPSILHTQGVPAYQRLHHSIMGNSNRPIKRCHLLPYPRLSRSKRVQRWSERFPHPV
ncbi:hypothetical protein NLI96_g10790 [Meripilus lineatus]|uniref:Uncharacterized protein n=1 Tax=Meripilus lineatus TaxID=2056292 RepID=A0AAD5UVC1_9APHY|nr:hypothetical protein NLI96_g10790 [Physisporinus lineatus]